MVAISTGCDQLGLLSDSTSVHTPATTIQNRQQLEGGQGRSVGMSA